ncbi:MAG: glutamate racemase [Clostridium sulfidigenes]|uniref:Glutamate racemase n=1 Tax=Clostridium sulfidigenes TaxID=318464 RepID=A0A927W717_9CLOT|nr:glutamate racemase [Clostridium sulfidigenes]
MDKTNFSIGFFDSGVGGISVLKEAVKLLPKENYIYIGDSLNAPYGVKTPEEVRKLTFNMVDKLISMNVKAIVVACNTATSIAIDELRRSYKEIPIIGIEPALKPAVENYGNGIIVIMATPMTLSENKFSKLRERYNKASDIISMPCDGLVEIIEDGNIKGEVVEGYLRNRFKDVPKERVSSVVLGCTHYPFIKEALVNVINDDVAIIDGSLGTVKQLKRKLDQKGLLNTNNEQGTVKIYNSKDDKNLIELSYKLLDVDKNSK